MVGRCLASALLAVAALSATQSAVQAGPRAVIELFTSQGCSSCPPADRLLGELANDPALVAISWPVDYWDYLGWKDTLAHPRSAARQTGYMKARGDRERYTPQAVVNGALHALGSSRDAIESAAAKSRQNPVVLSVPLKLSFAGGQILVVVPDMPKLESGAEIWIAGLARKIAVAIKRGENRGRTIGYHNVLRSWTKLGSWNGAASTWKVSAAEIARDGVDSAAVLLQAGSEHKPGAILGAAIAALR
jgi:hypothetical protein